ncbi:uncharacterized protein LOC143538691 [Bidens hawaiensis]|uniref:uncharacterized protein LOC143538691 n=1 Tax=Bidens hawaiensis TaxID=980011 RepID=UPI00404AED87
MADLQVVGGIKKLNNQNYNTWSTCMMSYLQGQDLWEVVNGAETAVPRNDLNGAVNKWRIKVGKAMFVLKTTVEEEVLEQFREAVTPKEVWDILAKLFSKKNDAKLQLLENELLSITQQDRSIAQYFHKVKTLCREIGELDNEARIGEVRMKQILIHGLKPEYHSFIAVIQGWPNQPTIGEFENLLASQEALAKQMSESRSSVPAKSEEEALYVGKGRGRYRDNEGYNNRGRGVRPRKLETRRNYREPERDQEAQDGDNKYPQNRPFPYPCYNCGKRGHMAPRLSKPTP